MKLNPGYSFRKAVQECQSVAVEITWSIVLAAGSGSRFGGNKQLTMLGHQRVVEWSVEAARVCCHGVILVINPENVEDVANLDVDFVVPGGSSRGESVRNGLKALPEAATVVVIHDAARPGAPAKLFRSVIDAVEAGADGAVPGLAVPDTLKQVQHGPRGKEVISTLDRDTIMAIQTPQAFDRKMLEAAHADTEEATDDAALIEAIGGFVEVVPGDAKAIKITEHTDLAIAAELMGLNQ